MITLSAINSEYQSSLPITVKIFALFSWRLSLEVWWHFSLTSPRWEIVFQIQLPSLPSGLNPHCKHLKVQYRLERTLIRDVYYGASGGTSVMSTSMYGARLECLLLKFILPREDLEREGTQLSCRLSAKHFSQKAGYQIDVFVSGLLVAGASTFWDDLVLSPALQCVSPWSHSLHDTTGTWKLCQCGYSPFGHSDGLVFRDDFYQLMSAVDYVSVPQNDFFKDKFLCSIQDYDIQKSETTVTSGFPARVVESSLLT